MMAILTLVAQGKMTSAVTPQTALIVAVVAAVLGPVIGAVLTFIGGVINDHFASVRERRQHEREDLRRQEDREHEKRVRTEQQHREDALRLEQQQREDELRIHAGRLRAYQMFIEASTIQEPLADQAKAGRHMDLNKSYIETQLYASDYLTAEAEALYKAADKAIDTLDRYSSVWSELDSARKKFLEEARGELERDLREETH